jgi:hypothetical protein
MPRITTANTMAPRVIIGELAAEMLSQGTSYEIAHDAKRQPESLGRCRLLQAAT